MLDDWKARDDQIDTLAKLIRNPRFMDLSDPGTGKTLPACLYTEWSANRNNKPVVWTQPLAIIKKNRDELLRFTNLGPDDIQIVTGGPEARKKIYRKKPKVLLTGPDNFGREWEHMVDGHPIGLLIGDEWHMQYSGNDSQRTQSLYRAMRHIERLEVMTGTIIRGKLSSAYPAIHLIEPRYYGNYRAFMNHHAIMDDWGKVACWINKDKLIKILGQHSVRRTFKEIYGDVPVVFLPETVQMSAKQAEAYKEFDEKASLELEKVILDGSLPGVNLIRARQILSCPEVFGLCHGETTGRDERLMVHLAEHAETGEPFMIGSASKDEQIRIKALCEKMGFRVGLMNGDTLQKQRGVIDERFRQGHLDGVIVSPQVGSIGFNWGHCKHCIFLHLDYFDDNFEQFWKRMTRGVVKHQIRVTVITYEDTVEEAVVGVIVNKMKLANSIDPTKQVVNLFAAGKGGGKYDDLMPLPGGFGMDKRETMEARSRQHG